MGSNGELNATPPENKQEPSSIAERLLREDRVVMEHASSSATLKFYFRPDLWPP